MSRNFILFALLAGAFACAEAGGGSGDFAEGGIGGSGISQGPITEFGSLFVNGIEWFLDDAEIEFDGETVAIAGFNESQKTALFNLGMVVRVEGTIDSSTGIGQAERVFFDDEIEGPVSGAVDEVDMGVPGQFRELTVLGQSILLEEGVTQFFDEKTPEAGAPDFGFTTIDVGDVVEISGLLDDRVEEAGVLVLLATSVERQEASQGPTEVELKGIVSGFDAFNSTFMLGIVTVQFDVTSTDLSDLPGDEVADGMVVEVKGTLSESDDNVIVADEIELEESFDDDDVDEFSTTGFVNGCVEASICGAVFFVGNQQVDASGEIEFEHGNASMLVNGRRIEVEGELIGGILIAEEIEFEDQEVRVYAAIAQAEDIDVAAGSFTLLGIEIRVLPSTRFEDDRDGDEDFGVNKMSAEDFLEVRGQADAQGVITAFRVERDESDEIRLYGNLESFDALTGELVILGVTVPTSGAAFKIDADPSGVEKECFFSNLEEGDFVEVKGDDDSDTELVSVKDVKLVKEGATSCD
jgi:hypothetical protein